MGEDIASKFANLFNPKHIYNYHKRCIDNFGIKFMSMMFTVYFITGGILNSLIESAQLPFYQSRNLLSNEYSLNLSIAMLPSSTKGFMGVLSDAFPLFGYNKSSYMMLTTAIGFLGNLLLLALPDSILFSFIQFPAILILLIKLEVTTHDSMTEGKYAQKMIEKSKSKTDLVTFAYFYLTFGEFLPPFLVGAWSDANLETKYLFFFTLPLTLHPIILLYFGCMVDDKVPAHKKNKLDIEKITMYGKVFFLAALIATFATISLILAVFASETVIFLYSLGAAIFLISITFYCLPVIIGKANIYMFLCDMVYFNLSGPLDYWYTADEDCVPGGPHFNFSFYITTVSVVKTFAKLLGVILFQTIVSGWKLRPIYWVTTLLRVFSSLSDVVMVKRWNLLIGIPDGVFFLLGNTIVYQTLYMVDYMPTNFLIAKLCPKSMETCVFAILVGFANYGTSLGGFFSLFFQSILNISGGDNVECNYDNLVWLILICNVAGPLINIINTFWLIPNVKLSEDFVKDYYDHKHLGFGKKSIDNKQQLV